MPPLSATRMRLERLGDERANVYGRIEDTLKLAEDEQRDLDEFEQKHLANWRERAVELEEEIGVLASDLDRAGKSRDVSELLRADDRDSHENGGGSIGDPIVYRTFAQFARDLCIVKYPMLAAQAAANGDAKAVIEAASERLERQTTLDRVQNTLTSDVQGLLPPQFMAQILDLINKSRPVVESARSVPLDRGKLNYPRITGRPQVLKQAAEKTEAGTAKMSVVMDQLTAETYLGGGDISWQTIQWSTPDALSLWFDLAAEAYAQQTESRACAELGTAGGGTITGPLGTTGTESFAQWRTAAIAALGQLYTGTGGRAQTDTLWLSAQRFFQLAGLGTDQVLQVSSVGALDIASMRGTWAGLRVIGSYGFTNPNTAIVGDASAFLAGENPGAPVEMRAVEPAIGGMEVGVIGAFQAKVFDPLRFMHLS